jgi:prefoldin subunit 5
MEKRIDELEKRFQKQINALAKELETMHRTMTETAHRQKDLESFTLKLSGNK